MDIKELNEAIKSALLEDEELDPKEVERQDLNKKLYEIVPYALCRTKDAGLLEYIYAYFDDRYKVAWQGGVRNDNRGMLLCYWVERETPEELCLYLTSDHNNLFMSGSTHWAVPAKSFDDKVNVLKQIKSDIDKLVEDSDKFPKTLYGGEWKNYGDDKNIRLCCSLCVSEKLSGYIGSIQVTSPDDNNGWVAQITSFYEKEIVEGDSIAVLDELKEKIKDRVILNLPDISNAKTENYRPRSLGNLSMNESFEKPTEALLKANPDKFYKISDRANSNCICWDGIGYEIYIFEYMDGDDPMYSCLSRFKTFEDAIRVGIVINRNHYNYEDCLKFFPDYDDMQI